MGSHKFVQLQAMSSAFRGIVLSPLRRRKMNSAIILLLNYKVKKTTTDNYVASFDRRFMCLHA